MTNDARNEGKWDDIKKGRDFMKCPDFAVKMLDTDQSKDLPQPPLCLESREKVKELPADFESLLTSPLYTDLLDNRRSLRVFDSKKPMTQNELAFLLWSSQGVQEIRGKNYATFRPVPSGGARHAFETYFIARNVQGLEPGLYHYLPLEHIGQKRVSIELLKELDDCKALIPDMLAGQKWTSAAPVVLFFSCLPYRCEWRYTDMSHRVALIDLGHIGQNLMLSAAAMGMGSCCLAAYNQKLCDEILGLDGFEQYTVYACAIGRGR